jgi:signal transduction histidine kinase
MIEFLLINKVLIFFINVIALWLTFLVYHNNPKGKINKLFILMTASMLFWVNFAYFARFVGQNQIHQSLLFIKIAWFVTPLLFLFLSLVAVYIIQEEKKYRLLNKIVLFLGITTAFVAGFTNLVIEGIKFENGNLIVLYGKGMLPFLAVVMFLMYATLYPLLKKYFKSLKQEKKKIEFFLIGIFIFYLANIIFNIALPIKFKVSQYYYLGDYSTIFLLGFTTYAIVKKELFGIKVVLTSIFVSLIAILLLFDILFLTPDFLHQLFKGLILIIFLYFGYSLIKSVLNEIKRREQLEKLTLKLEKINIRLKKLLKMKEEFLHITSHQLRTPLTAIRGMVSMWCEGDFKKLSQTKKDEIKKRIYLSTERLNNITNDMIDAMELEGGGWLEQHNFKSIFLPQVIQETIETLKTNFDKKGLYIKFNYPKNLPKIQGAENYLRQVFMNLIDNAQKYTPKGGVNISLKKENNFLACEIADTGIGISQKGKERLFKKFSRGKRAEHFYTSGTGLGLFIAKKIIEEHQGKISVFSKGENKGTTFKVCLPVKK